MTKLINYRIDAAAADANAAAAEAAGLTGSDYARAAVALRRWTAANVGPECSASTPVQWNRPLRTQRGTAKCARTAGHAGAHVSADGRGHVIVWGGDK